jgi:hypothetical protein
MRVEPMTTDAKERDLQEIGKSAYESIAEMVAAEEVDYDRLRELKEERDALEGHDRAAWNAEYAQELAELVAAAGECESRENAEQRIQEDPLSIEVRSGWTTLDQPLQAEEFNILLGTGGPAVRIVGELDMDREPTRAWLEVQDWFLPWTRYHQADVNVLLAYCRQFYFGD